MNNLLIWCSLACLISFSYAQGTTKAAAAALPATLKLFVGGEDKEVQVFTFDTAKGTATPLAKSDALGPNAIWLEFNKDKSLVFSASADKFGGKEGTGGVFSASVAADGTLKQLSSTQTDEAPVFIEISPDEKLAMVATFNGGSLVTYDIAAGKLSAKPKQTFPFTVKKTGPVKDRQAKGYCCASSQTRPLRNSPPGTRFGCGRSAHVQSGQESNAQANQGDPGEGGMWPPPSGLRPEKSKVLRFYLLCELSSDLLLIETDLKKIGTIVQTLNVLPTGAKPGLTNTFNAGEILISPDNKFLYTTNRQRDKAGKVDDNIFSVFERDLTNGKLTAKGTFPTGGKGPRHFSFSPDPEASMVVVSNQESNIVNFHKRDPTTGALTLLKTQVEYKSPAVALFRA
ncbi:hypothetical protein PSTT_12301 [Puccinia striiformis]|uniref:3-carboxymuconate cyclase n=1 Tax=Puccinia striiformis TaxID=27350 RepID=A0A2S4UWQ2_9BASI|nr:hypothetical protein PSTT_12301 [Puccinia striiformis]